MTTKLFQRKQRVLLGISLISTAFPMAARAQASDPAEPVLPRIQVVGEKQQDNEHNYTARNAPSVLRSAASLFETAQSVTVVTGQQIEERQAKSVAEALDGVAGVTSGAYGRRGWDDFMIRGQISSAQTYVDGLRTQNSTNVLRAEDIFGVSSIEVVKGPTSVGFGMALPGGLVNLTTKRPQAETSFNAGLSYGSYAQKDATVDLNVAPKGSSQGAFRLVAHVSDQDDPTDHVYFKSQYVAGSYNFDLNARNELSVIASYQHREYIRNQGVPLNWSEKYGRSIFVGEPDRPYKVDVYRLGSNYTHYFGDGWTFKQNLTVTSGSSWTNSVFAAGAAKFPLVARQINNQDKQDLNVAMDNYFQRSFDFGRIKYDIVTGLDTMRERSDYYQRVDNVNALNADTLVYGITSTKLGTPSRDVTYTQDIGLYLRNTIKIDDRWIVGLSGRQDWARVKVQHLLGGADATNSNTAFTGNASLMYRINDAFAPYASYATSFMPGTDLGANGSLLKPETGKQTEAGVKFQGYDQRLQGYVAVYDLVRQNVTEADATLGYSVQTGEQETKGFEAEVAAALTRQWNVSASYSYIPFAKTTESLTTTDIGKRINLVPKSAVGLFTRYYFSPNKMGWNAGANARFQSARTAQRGVNYVALAEHTVFDVNAGYEAASWSVNLSVKNLFDKEYIQGTTPAATLITFGSPRTALLTAKFKF
ncbi:TonB-dependent siderophore receptor [Pseudoduganella sp. FT25W]|uniref:TonB-dependent siderophore receptor n=1 Tax=Duganella alba TaxID=2666081 RepID=A0A6L5QEP5_9BURK|nr:TonB-dependent receptor [Duganella alba]MRX07762.1 TonB-dependent siderophore receptor [Duganella alba]MRX15365.1 TonB-dependent siderophore receptor [Duganella alba]